ncbi:MAG: UxaA family hydrolase [Planctomycetota bacterium]
MSEATIRAWPRGEQSAGIRNHVLVVSSVCCANFAVERIAAEHPGVIPITHQHGCTHLGDDREQVLRTLAGTCGNPNVGGVLLVGLGCESISTADIESRVSTEGRVVRSLVIQDAGGLDEMLAAAETQLRDIRQAVALREPEDRPISELTVALECGGSDPFSGITANPLIGRVADRLVAAGATVILAETPEMIGAEDALSPRIADPEHRRKLLACIARYTDAARRQGCDLRGVNPTPGNIRAGLSSIEEKSLGCVVKGGTSPIREVLDYAEKPAASGLVVMDTPGNDPESVTGMAAGGATLVLFSTGVGTPLGCAVAPVVKIASNTPMARRMADYIDLDAGALIEGTGMDVLAERLWNKVLLTANGTPTCSERNGCHEFAINRIGPTY